MPGGRDRAPSVDPGNAPYRQRFAVSYEYPVYFTRDAFDPANTALRDALGRAEFERRQRAAVYIDAGVAEAHPDLPAHIRGYFDAHADSLALIAEPETVTGGEAAKHDRKVVDHVLGRLAELGVDRHSHVLIVGGGAVLDAVGYAAAVAHRGVRTVRMPTTVLAQNDSGVGVKVGINALGVKNMVGSFAPPFAVVNDTGFLASLAHRDKIAGIAEAVKVALIRDGVFFAWLEQHADELAAFRGPAVDHMIRRCAELHMDQIAHGGDPFETGSARPLDYGHWAAHKLETLTGYALRHGEAVAIGMALDARYATLAGMLEAGADERVCRLLERLGFRLWHDALDWPDATGQRRILRGLQEFREHLGGELTVTLLAGIGRGREVHSMSDTRVAEAVAWLRARDGAAG